MFRTHAINIVSMKLLVADIIAQFPVQQHIGNTQHIVAEVIQLSPSNKRNDILTWCNLKKIALLADVNCGCIIIPAEAAQHAVNPGCVYLLVENPRNYFQQVLKHFFDEPPVKPHVSSSAVIAPSAKIGLNASIERNVVIHDNCVIGDNAVIRSNTIIHRNTIIGNNVSIGANNIIGFHGFGYEENQDGHNELMPHIGNVIIHSHVEIGNNNCIDRSVLGSTIIGQYTKIHNFVQIAHGVTIGHDCLVTANVTISGTTSVGNHVWLGPAVTISNKLKIGNNAYLAIGAVIIQDVPENATVTGNPARIIKINN